MSENPENTQILGHLEVWAEAEVVPANNNDEKE